MEYKSESQELNDTNFLISWEVKKLSDIKTWSIDKVLCKENFRIRICWIFRPDLYLILVNYLKYSQCIQETLF